MPSDRAAAHRSRPSSDASRPVRGRLLGVAAAPIGLLVVLAVCTQGLAAEGAAGEWVPHLPDERPPARWGHQIAFDAARERLVLFGGTTTDNPSEGLLGDTWEWDGESWAPAEPPVAPMPRYEHSLVYDPIRERVVLFGGKTNALAASGGTSSEGEHQTVTTLRDMWEWDGVRWTPVPQSNNPVEPFGALWFDESVGRLSLFAGASQGPGHRFASSWHWTGDAWTETLVDPQLADRRDPAVAYDSTRDRLVVFGGRLATAGFPYTDEHWEWDGQNWTQVELEVPSPRQAGATYHTAAQRTVMFGAWAPRGLLNETWTWDGSSWDQVQTSAAPSPRIGFAMTYDPTNEQIVLYGGGGRSGNDPALWTLSLDADLPTATPTTTPTSLPPPNELFIPLARVP